ncbi:substrate-binding periplasmic protein [Undibacterium sp. RuTC16W]|uniref:substrate-binding periplasmic protein n=1 Tax=Undibacterium sp. RuTC16W TaxID=3413048 RepID=UPI003BEF85DA
MQSGQLPQYLQQTSLAASLPSLPNQSRRRLVAAIAALCTPAMAWSARERIVLLIGEANPEKNTQIPTNTGFNATLSYIQKELDADFEIRHYPSNRLIQNIVEGEGLAFGLSKTKERLRTLHFSIPAYTTYIWMVTLSDSVFPFKSVQDLKTKTIGVVRGASYGEEFEAQKNGLTLEEDTYSIVSRLQKLILRRTDIMLLGYRSADPAQVETLMNSLIPKLMLEPSLPAGVKFAVIPKPFSVDHIHFAIAANKDKGIIDRINAALRNAKKSGVLE